MTSFSPPLAEPADPASPSDKVDKLLGQSRYGALAGALKARIIAAEWPPGSAMPAEQSLASQHGVALGTLRQALALLVDEGLVDRVHGKGTFVRAGLSGAPMLRFFRFGSTRADSLGKGRGAVPTSRIVSRQVLAAPAAVARALSIGAGDTVLRIRRLRSLDNVPRLVEEIWLLLPLCAGMSDSDPATWGDLLYPALVAVCGVHVHRAVDEISFGRFSAADAKALALPTGHPCAVVRRQAYDLAGRCMEVRTTRGDATAFQYTVSIT